jgi:hypothetical protein
VSEEPELLEIQEAPTDLLIPCGEGAVWIENPVAFCNHYQFEALKTDGMALYGLRAGNWVEVGKTKLKLQ